MIASRKKKRQAILIFSVMAIIIYQGEPKENFEQIMPDNSYSDNAIIYKQQIPLPIKIQNSFSVVYPQKFQSFPDIAFGISGYQGIDQLYNQLFLFYIKEVTQTLFNLEAKIESPTSIVYVRISYLAIQDKFDTIYVVTHSYTTFKTFSSSKISLSIQQLVFQPNLSLINETWGCQYYLNGIYVHSSDKLDLQLSSCHVNEEKNISIVAKVESTSSYQKINLLFLLTSSHFIEESDHLRVLTYKQSFGEVTIEQGKPNFSSSPFNLKGIFMMGLSSMRGLNSKDKFDFSWENKIINGNQEIVFKFGQPYKLIKFNYFSLVKIICVNSYWNLKLSECTLKCPQNYTNAPLNKICERCNKGCAQCGNSPTNCLLCSSNYILIEQECQPISTQQIQIYSLVSILIIVSFVIIFIICVCKKKKIKNENKKIEVKNHPSIQL